MTQEEPFFTRDRLRAIGLGIGRGFQSYDPNNPFAGAGAALEGTIGTEMAIEDRKRGRDEAVSDRDSAEQARIRAEKRAEEADIRAQDRAEESRVRAEKRNEQARREATEWDRIGRFKDMQVGTVSQGANSESARRAAESMRQFREDFARMMSGRLPRYSGNAPIDPYADDTVMPYEARGLRRGRDYSTPDDKPVARERGMMRTSDGRMVKAVEDKDQNTPLFGEGGRSRAY
jgi:hypothetical protein